MGFICYGLNMEFTRVACKVISLVFYLAAIPPAAQAADEPSPLILNARYIISWSGITLGRINVTAREDDQSYSLSVDTKTRGLGAVITDEASVVTAHGSKGADASYIPALYHSGPQGKTERDITDLIYDAHGDIATRTRTPEDDPAWRPQVPFAQINTGHDPITGALMLRRALYEANHSATAAVSTRTYDGARLAEMKMSRMPNVTLDVLGTDTDAVNVRVTRTPINGYTPKELKKFNKGDPEIHLYFSNDRAFIPIKASAKVMVGELSVTLVDTNTH